MNKCVGVIVLQTFARPSDIDLSIMDNDAKATANKQYGPVTLKRVCVMAGAVYYAVLKA